MPSVDTLRIIEASGNWAAAFATLAAVGVALWLQVWLNRKRRPKLELIYDHKSPSDNRYLAPSDDASGPGKNRQELWVRLRVRNTSRHPARDIELKLIATIVGNDPQRQNRPGWSFKVSNLDASAVTIHPKFTQYFDVAYLIFKKDTSELSAHFVLTMPDTLSWNSEKKRIEENIQYTGITIGWPHQVLFALVGSNIEARYFRMDLQVAPVKAKEITEVVLRTCLVANQPIEITPDDAFDLTRNPLAE